MKDLDTGVGFELPKKRSKAVSSKGRQGLSHQKKNQKKQPILTDQEDSDSDETRRPKGGKKVSPTKGGGVGGWVDLNNDGEGSLGISYSVGLRSVHGTFL